MLCAPYKNSWYMPTELPLILNAVSSSNITNKTIGNAHTDFMNRRVYLLLASLLTILFLLARGGFQRIFGVFLGGFLLIGGSADSES